MDVLELEVLNWDAHQRKDVKRPTWFALSNNILEDSKLFGLTDAEWKALIYIFCEASKQRTGKIQLNLSHAERVALITRDVLQSAVTKLCHAGVTSTSRARNVHVRATSLHRQTNRQTNTSVASLPPVALSWNEEVKRLRKVKKLNPKRLAVVKKHEGEYDPAGWKAIFQRADKSNFLAGGGSRGWVATLDWVMKNSDRIEEGEFDGKSEELGAGSMRGA